MLALFCLRLTWGMLASLLILPVAQVHPRFFRVHFLIALGLLAVAGFFLIESMTVWLGAVLVMSMLCCFAGSVVWHVEGRPLSGLLLVLAVLSVTGLQWIAPQPGLAESAEVGLRRADDFSSAALLGSSMSAMLMGHSYLIAPAMSLTPLMRLLAAMGISLAVRVVLAGIGLFQWTDHAGPAGLGFENVLWLSLRWLLGFVAVLVLGWMAWETARIRSTQSATGILYVVVIVCFLGELTSQFLVLKTGYIL